MDADVATKKENDDNVNLMRRDFVLSLIYWVRNRGTETVAIMKKKKNSNNNSVIILLLHPDMFKFALEFFRRTLSMVSDHRILAAYCLVCIAAVTLTWITTPMLRKFLVVFFVLYMFLFIRRQSRSQSNSSSDPIPPVDVILPDSQRESTELSSGIDPVPPAINHEYDVFLSFRGSDTRKTFTDCLYYRLKEAGIRVFRDEEELRVGEDIGLEIMMKIRQSKISMPVFSQDYASSKWCLDEFTMMMECRRQTTQLVLPIFFDVKPGEVRHQTGRFGRSFQRHRWHYQRMKRVPEWRKALQEVGSLKGLELDVIADGHHGKLIERVLVEVLGKLRNAHLLVPDMLVGVDNQVDEILRLLDVGTPDVRIVGICGIGGIGKTTIAKFIYNHILDRFQYHSFLEFVQESSQRDGLRYLQSKLVADLSRSRCDSRVIFTSVDEGMNELSRFSDKKVLILLDDIDESSQLNALVAESWFAPGSRIILTTKNKKLVKPPVWAHEVEAMKPGPALHLFYKHAFGVDRPPPNGEMDNLSKKIVQTTGGLPLAIEVIGSFLYKKHIEIWKDTFGSLKRIPDEKVQRKLRICFDALSYDTRQIFLDIACFFIGVDKRIVYHMWRACGFYPELELERLQLRSLIKVGDDNRLSMHVQLRDLGRELVRQENPDEPWLRSRLWCGIEAREVLQQERSFVRAMALQDHPASGMKGYSIEGRSFKHLGKLRFLRLEHANLTGDFQHCLPNMTWLSCQKCTFESTANNLELEKLVILDLSGSSITEDWMGWGIITIYVNLKVLCLSGCHKLTRTPDFFKFPNLERLILEGCSKLSVIDKSIEHLKTLSSLNLRSCSRLMELPEKLGSVKSLTEVILDGTCIKTIPSLGGIKKLETLSARGCRLLTQITIPTNCSAFLSNLVLDSSLISELPESIGLLVELRRLSANYSSLEKLPNSIGQLKSLVELSLSGTKVTTLPDSIGRLSNLEVLNIDCSNIIWLPVALGKLEKLELLNASGCKHLEGEIPIAQGRLSRLKVLSLGDTKISTIPATITGLSHLQTLNLTGCKQLDSLPELPASLVNVGVTCKSREMIPNLANLINLKELRFSECLELEEIPGDMVKLSKLEKLELSGMRSISALPDALAALSQLKELSIENCVKLESLPALPLSLNKLVASSVNHLSQGPPNFWKLGGRLLELSLLDCYVLTKIPGLGKQIVLTILKVIRCPQITTLPGLENLKSLRFLHVLSCKNLAKLPNLSKLKKLTVMRARDCEKLVLIQSLGSLHELRDLDVGDCSSLEILPNLFNLKSLRSFCADGCKKLRRLPGISELEELASLRMSGCKETKGLPDLSKLKKLRLLDISGCDKITEIPGLLQLSSLERLVISRSVSIAKIQDLQQQYCSPNLIPSPDPGSGSGSGSASFVNRVLAACRDPNMVMREGFSAPLTSEGTPLTSFGGLTVALDRGHVIAVYPSNSLLPDSSPASLCGSRRKVDTHPDYHMQNPLEMTQTIRATNS